MASLLRASFVGDKVQALLDRKKKFVKRPFTKRVGRLIGEDVKASVRRELAGEFTYLRAGGRKSFASAIDFPNRKPGPTLGGPGGFFGRAWDAAKVTTPSGRTVRVAAELGPRGVSAMGGSGLIRRVDHVTIIRAKGDPRRMAGAVSASTGVHISTAKAQSGFRWPARVHGQWHPELTEKAAERVATELENA